MKKVCQFVEPRRQDSNHKFKHPVGGSKPSEIPGSVVKPYVTAILDDYDNDEIALKFKHHTDSVGLLKYPILQGSVHTMVPLSVLVPYLSKSSIQIIVRKHNIKLSSRLTRAELLSLFDQHDCLSCNLLTSVFKIIPIECVK
ncbi:hypothetical protein L208DRAFT_1286528 [Tricholoma matsutake]|nr:hypothetical protein L208DRAFT_1286528 [Tricholoma matsutake 945]